MKDFDFHQDWVTWVGHGLQGIAGCAVAYYLASINAPPWAYAAAAMLYFFGAREIPGIIKAAIDGELMTLVDGIMDMVSPFIGIGIFTYWIS